MAFLRNDAVNRVNLHFGVVAFANAGAGVFVLVFLLQAGAPAPIALLALGAIMAARFAIRPLLLPLAKRIGIKPLLSAGALVIGVQYALVGFVDGVGPIFVAACAIGAIGEVCYWLGYNSYYAAVGDPEHRGHQIGAREALAAMASVTAPLLGAWALVTAGPPAMFVGFALIQFASVLPLIGAPNVAVPRQSPGAFRAAREAMIYNAADGWFDTWYFFVWQIALFVALRESFAAYGAAMALAALVGAVAGALLGRYVDAGHGKRAVTIAFGAAALVIALRAASMGAPWLAVLAHASGAIAMTLMSPAIGAAVYNMSRASGCPFRFAMATEGAWDLGGAASCVLAAALTALHAPFALQILIGLPALWIAGWVLRRYYGAIPARAPRDRPLPAILPSAD